LQSWEEDAGHLDNGGRDGPTKSPKLLPFIVEALVVRLKGNWSPKKGRRNVAREGISANPKSQGLGSGLAEKETYDLVRKINRLFHPEGRKKDRLGREEKR